MFYLSRSTKTRDRTSFLNSFEASRPQSGKQGSNVFVRSTLKAHGLQGQALRDVTLATLVAQLLYASPAWNGFIKN